MHQKSIERLLEEHRSVEGHLREVENQCELMERGDQPSLAILKAAGSFLEGEVMRAHHLQENHLYILLSARLPRFAEEIFDVRRDREQSSRAIARFTRALEHFEFARCDRVALAHIARAMVGNERGHIIAEEELFFPYVVRHLKTEEETSLLDGRPATAQ